MTPRAPGPSLLELSRDASWEERLAVVPVERVAALLAEADTLRGGEAEERSLALAAYRALQTAVDPSAADGCDRVEWVLDALKAIDQRFDPLLRRAGCCASRPQVRRRARVALGAFRVQAGALEEGEALFIGVLAKARGKGGIPERAACLNLCRLYRRQWRVFEGYVMSRYAVRLFQEADDGIRELFSEVEVLACLCEMEEWDAFDALLPRAEELLATLPPGLARQVGADLFLWRLKATHTRGRLDEALAMLDGLEREPEGERRLVLDQSWWRQSKRAAVLTDLGRLDEAAELFGAARDAVPADGAFYFRHLELEAVCAARRGEPGLAVANARVVLDTPPEDLLARLGSGGTLQICVGLAVALRDHGHEDLARQGFDLAAMAAVERIRETGRAVRELPELACVTPEDRALLARAQRRFADAHRDLLHSIASLFERAAASGESWLEQLRCGEHALVCAWCARVRDRDGTWVPVAHFLPQEGPLLMTHGMCAECAELQWRQLPPSRRRA